MSIKLTSGHPCNVILSAVPVVFIYQANVADPPVLIATVGIVLVEYNVSTVLSPPNMEESWNAQFMHPTGQGHDVSTPPSLNASWTVAQAPLERNSLVSSAAWTNTLIPPKLLLILVVVSFVYTVPGRRFLHFHHGTCLYCRNSIYCSQTQFSVDGICRKEENQCC